MADYARSEAKTLNFLQKSTATKQFVQWHECKDVDLAVWLAHLQDLDGLRWAKDSALRALQVARGIGVASHQVDAFVLQPGTGRYLGAALSL